MEKEELCVTRAACIEAADLKKIRFNVKRIFVERRFFFSFLVYARFMRGA